MATAACRYISDSIDYKEETSSSYRYADRKRPEQQPNFRYSAQALLQPHVNHSENLDINHEIDDTPFRLNYVAPEMAQEAGPESTYQQRLQQCDSTFYNNIFEVVESPEALRYAPRRPKVQPTVKQSNMSRNYFSTLVTEVTEDAKSNGNVVSKSDWFEPGILAGSMTLDFRNMNSRSAVDPSKASQSSPAWRS